MKKSDLKKIDSKTSWVIASLISLGFKYRELGVYSMYANVHITIPSNIDKRTLMLLFNDLPEGSTIGAGNNFRSGLTIRLPWNFPDENYEKNKTVFD